MPWLYRYSIQHPRTVISIAVALTLAVAPGMLRLKLRTDGHALVPPTADAIRADQAIRRQFGTQDQIVVLIQANHPDGIFNVHTLELIRTLTTEFQQGGQKIAGVGPANVTSLATEASDRVIPGTIRFQNLLDPLPTKPDELLRLRGDLDAIRLYTGTVASRDGKSTAIFVGVPDGAIRTVLAQQIRDQIDTHGPFPETIHVIGAPVAESLLGTQILDDLGVPDRLLGRHATSLTAQQPNLESQKSMLDRLRSWIARHIGLVPVTMAIMASVFLICFRTVWAAIMPLMEVGACLVVTFGLMGWFDVPIYLTIAIMPVVLIVTTVSDEVHLFGRYARELRERPADPHAEVVGETMNQMWRPILKTTLTTAIGFLSFLTSPMKPVQAFGVWTGIGSLFGLFWSMSVIPAQLVLLGRRRVLPGRYLGVEGLLSATTPWFERLGKAMLRYRYVALAVAGLLVASTPLGLRRLYVQDSWIDGFAPASAFRSATREFNQHFLGTHLLQICVQMHRPEFHGEVDSSAVDGQFVRLPATLVSDPEALIGYELMLTRQRPQVVKTGLDVGKEISLSWLSWVIGSEREGDHLLVKASLNRGMPGAILHLDPGDLITFRLKPNPFKTPAVLERVAALESFVSQQHDAKVGGVIGPVAFLKTTGFMGHARKESWRSIPNDPEQIDFLWKQYKWVRGDERLKQVVDDKFESGLITVYMNDANFVDTGRLIDRLRAYEKSQLAPQGISLALAGDVAVSQTLIQAIVSTQVRSLIGSLGGIFLVVAVLARSIWWGIYCVLPCCLGVLLNFAVMGWVGMPLGVATSMFAAVTLGIGVDYAIHLLECYQHARSRGRTHEAGLIEAVKVTGPPVLVDALAVSLGFGVMCLSQVPANARLGGLVVLNLASCLAATLLVLPALLDIYQPRVLFRGQTKREPSAAEVAASTEP